MTEIIVYRNPFEAAMWNALSTGSGMTIFLIVLGLGLLWVLLYQKLEKPLKKKYGYFIGAKYNMRICSTVVVLVAIGLHFYNIYG